MNCNKFIKKFKQFKNNWVYAKEISFNKKPFNEITFFV